MISFSHKTNHVAHIQIDNIANVIFKRIALAVGWFENSKYDDNTRVADVAMQNEFGDLSKNIPPRPFMRPLIAEQRENWIRLISSEIKKEINNGGKIENALGRVAMVVQGEIQESISDVYTPKLAPYTIAKRREKLANGSRVAVAGIDKPLIDTGIMFNSVSHKIIEGGIGDKNVSEIKTETSTDGNDNIRELINKSMINYQVGG